MSIGKPGDKINNMTKQGVLAWTLRNRLANFYGKEKCKVIIFTRPALLTQMGARGGKLAKQARQYLVTRSFNLYDLPRPINFLNRNFTNLLQSVFELAEVHEGTIKFAI